MSDDIRIGLLGAAKIASSALVGPAEHLPGIGVAAIAARDSARAVAFAARHGIPRVHATYRDLLSDPTIDAVYVPLPATHHGHWTTAAIRAGKHVLVEKPFAANAFEARRVADAAAESDLVVMEAHHTRHHPLVDRLRFLLAGGVLGTVESAAATFRVPIPPGRALPWNIHLGGGALMDVGCYPVRMLLDLFGSEPVVESARAWTRREVDRTIRADLRFGASVRASVDCSIWSSRIFAARVTVWGTKGRMRVSMPYHPHERARIRIDGPRGLRLRETVSRRSSYSFQLEAFRDSIREGAAVVTDPAAAVRTMCVIDAIYRAAGMEPRAPGHVD